MPTRLPLQTESSSIPQHPLRLLRMRGAILQQNLELWVLNGEVGPFSQCHRDKGPNLTGKNIPGHPSSVPVGLFSQPSANTGPPSGWLLALLALGRGDFLQAEGGGHPPCLSG